MLKTIGIVIASVLGLYLIRGFLVWSYENLIEYPVDGEAETMLARRIWSVLIPLVVLGAITACAYYFGTPPTP